jgi:hypothetical protein
MWEKRNTCRILVGKPKGKRPPGRPRSRRVHNVKTNLRETRKGGVDWNDLVQDGNQWRDVVN